MQLAVNGMWQFNFMNDKWRDIPVFRHRWNHMADKECSFREHMAKVIALILQLAAYLKHPQAFDCCCIYVL
jgi:hypothetical protein